MRGDRETETRTNRPGSTRCRVLWSWAARFVHADALRRGLDRHRGSSPPSVGMALRNTRRTLELIRETGEFTVNIPSTALAAEVDYFGITSGRTTDKFADTGLSLAPAAVVSTPIVEQCPYNLECRVIHQIELGDYVFIVGEILETHRYSVLDPEMPWSTSGPARPSRLHRRHARYRGSDRKLANAFSVGNRSSPDEHATFDLDVVVRRATCARPRR